MLQTDDSLEFCAAVYRLPSCFTLWTAQFCLGLRTIIVQYGLDGPIVWARPCAVKRLGYQQDGQEMGRDHLSNTV